LKNVRQLSGLIAGLVVLLCSCTKPSKSAGFDWPQWRGPDGNGQSRETEWDPASLANPRVLWTVNVGLGYSNVAIQDGWLYTAGSTKSGFTLSCLNAATGKPRWTRSLGSSFSPQATPAVDGRDLFVLTTDGTLHALDARSGKPRWSRDLVREYGAVKPHFGFAGSPIVTDSFVLLTANTAGMAVRRETGDLSWISEKPPKEFRSHDRGASTGTMYSTPVLYGEDGSQRAIFVSWRGITSADVATGTPAWRFDYAVDMASAIPDPLIAGETVCVSLASDSELDYAGFLISLGQDAPRPLWRTVELVTLGPGPVAVGGYLYYLYYGLWGEEPKPPTSLRCLALTDGRLIWEERFGKDYQNKSLSLTAASGTLIIMDDKGTLRTARASPDGYQEIASCDVLLGASRARCFWTPPVLCNAKIYCRNYAGDLVCIDVSR
jgi:outer membrane protein assembly factor BamB